MWNSTERTGDIYRQDCVEHFHGTRQYSKTKINETEKTKQKKTHTRRHYYSGLREDSLSFVLFHIRLLCNCCYQHVHCFIWSSYFSIRIDQLQNDSKSPILSVVTNVTVKIQTLLYDIAHKLSSHNLAQAGK